MCLVQIIWDEVGETETEREKILIEIENECKQVYNKKIEKVKEERIRLSQEIADSEARIIAICSVMEETPILGRQHQSGQSGKSLKEVFRKVLQKLEEMEKRKAERKNQFIQVIEDIKCVRDEINGESSDEEAACSSGFSIAESDLSLRKLQELHSELYTLQEQKVNNQITLKFDFIFLIKNLRFCCIYIFFSEEPSETDSRSSENSRIVLFGSRFELPRNCHQDSPKFS